jgi:GST-like protein
MITLYAWDTPNGRKISIMLEELGVPYKVRCVDITKQEQFDPSFLMISPNNKIPAIVDDEPSVGEVPVALFESGAILTYLADKHGRFLDLPGPARWQALQWLHWQNSALGPVLGQLSFFAVRSAEKAPLAIERFKDEACRLLAVMESRLTESEYLAGDQYGIADISCYPWILATGARLEETLRDCRSDKPALRRWEAQIAARPSVVAGMCVTLKSS